MSDKTNELLLIETRGAAPLVRTLKDYDGNPAGTLGCIVGVAGIFIKVLLSSGGEPVSLLANEVEDVK